MISKPTFLRHVAGTIKTMARKKAKKALRSINRTVLRPLFVHPVRRVLKRQIPIALITGTKGKTTTTRMLARILREAGHVVGYASTDGIIIDSSSVSERDSSGYAGAARVLSDPSITAAVLETARGDLLDNGLYVDRCDVAALLNVKREHIGIDGIDTLEQMGKLKRKVIDSARKAVVLNADDPLCRNLINEFPVDRTSLFSFDSQCRTVQEHLKLQGVAFCFDESSEPRIVRIQGQHSRSIISIAEMPSAWGGIIRHNIANAMAAAALADGLGITAEIIHAGLRSFGATLEQSFGRFNIITDYPFLLILDRATSPPAAEALAECLAAVRVKGRRMCTLTAVGNRPDWHYRELAAALARSFNHFVCYEWPHYRRGRAPGVITDLLRSELLRQGVEANSIDAAYDYESALRIVSARSRLGDLVVVLGQLKRKDIPILRAAFASHLPLSKVEEIAQYEQ